MRSRLLRKAADGYAGIVIYLDVDVVAVEVLRQLNFERLLDFRWIGAFIRVPLDQFVGKRKHF